MKFILPEVYPITDRGLTGLTHAEQVRLLIDGGATLIQLREKDGSPREFFSDAEAALRIARRHGAKILINDRVDIALALGADGVHLGQEDLSPAHARAILGEDAIIGFSTHNTGQIAAAAVMPIDYLAIGPVFATKTKKNPDPVVGLSGVREAALNAPGKQIVAIGGIDVENIREVILAGAASAALISSVLVPAPNIQNKFRSLLSEATRA